MPCAVSLANAVVSSAATTATYTTSGSVVANAVSSAVAAHSAIRSANNSSSNRRVTCGQLHRQRTTVHKASPLSIVIGLQHRTAVRLPQHSLSSSPNHGRKQVSTTTSFAGVKGRDSNITHTGTITTTAAAATGSSNISGAVVTFLYSFNGPNSNRIQYCSNEYHSRGLHC
eukprot:Lankesteria_metandrocarpae@DN8752_c0_g1_i1.p1